MIRLEKFEKSDSKRLINWVDSEELMVLFSGPIFEYPITLEQLDTYLENPNRLVYKAIDDKTNQVIGHAELNNIDYRQKSARICRVIVGEKSRRKNGYGKQIINEITRIAFDELKLHRLDLGVHDFNKTAIECYKSCGFEIEGLLRDNTKIGDQYWSSYNMSKLNK